MANLFKQSYLPYLLFLAGVVLIFLWARGRRVEGFADAKVAGNSSGGSPYTFTLYYADWCPHCHSAKPAFEKLGSIQTIGGKQVQMHVIEEKQIPDSVKVSGYPTIRLMGPGGDLIEEYSGDRTTPALQAFLDKKLK